MAKDTPLNLSTALIYQIFPRHFSEAGDFRSIVPHLDRIKALHADIIWLTPIHPISVEARKGSMGSPYAAYDYRAVNPDYGTADDLSALASEIHRRGMKLIIDVVYNHTGVGSVLSKEHPEWFYHKDGSISRKFDEWSDVWDLDFSQSGLRDYLIDSLAQWLSCGVDGFRCDVATMVPADFWIEARRRLNRDRDVIWLAECTHLHFARALAANGFPVSADSELFEAFDMLYDYDGYEIIERWREGAASLREYFNHVYAQTWIYPRTSMKLRFIENHDQPRAAATYRGMDNLKNWTAFYFFLPGPSLIYAGQEICETVKPDLFEKGEIRWNEGVREFEPYISAVAAAAKLVKKDGAIYYHEEIASGVYRIRWVHDKEEFWMYLNLENRCGNVPVDPAVHGEDLLLQHPRKEYDCLRMEDFPVVLRVVK